MSDSSKRANSQFHRALVMSRILLQPRRMPRTIVYSFVKPHQ